MATRDIIDKHGRTHSITIDEGGRATLTVEGLTIGPMLDPGDEKFVDLVSMHNPPAIDLEPSYREKRADALFEALAQETTDDRVLVLGETVATLLDLVGTNIVAGKITATAEAGALLTKVAAVRDKIPKGALKKTRA